MREKVSRPGARGAEGRPSVQEAGGRAHGAARGADLHGMKGAVALRVAHERDEVSRPEVAIELREDLVQAAGVRDDVGAPAGRFGEALEHRAVRGLRHASDAHVLDDVSVLVLVVLHVMDLSHPRERQGEDRDAGLAREREGMLFRHVVFERVPVRDEQQSARAFSSPKLIEGVDDGRVEHGAGNRVLPEREDGVLERLARRRPVEDMPHGDPEPLEERGVAGAERLEEPVRDDVAELLRVEKALGRVDRDADREAPVAHEPRFAYLARPAVVAHREVGGREILHGLAALRDRDHLLDDVGVERGLQPASVQQDRALAGASESRLHARREHGRRLGHLKGRAPDVAGAFQRNVPPIHVERDRGQRVRRRRDGAHERRHRTRNALPVERGEELQGEPPASRVEERLDAVERAAVAVERESDDGLFVRHGAHVEEELERAGGGPRPILDLPFHERDLVVAGRRLKAHPARDHSLRRPHLEARLAWHGTARETRKPAEGEDDPGLRESSARSVSSSRRQAPPSSRDRSRRRTLRTSESRASERPP